MFLYCIVNEILSLYYYLLFIILFGGDSRQSADYVGTSWCYVSISIQLSSPAPPCRSNTVGRSKEDSSALHAFESSRLNYCNSLLFDVTYSDSLV